MAVRVQAGAQPERLGGGQQFVVSGPVDQAVFVLNADEGAAAAQARGRRGGGDPPRREVGQAAVQDLARADQVVEGGENFLHRGDGIRQVHPVQVDMIGAQPPQAALQRPDRVPPAVPRGVDAATRRGGPGVFRGQDEIVAARRASSETRSPVSRPNVW
jgi:hypothetical protein